MKATVVINLHSKHAQRELARIPELLAARNIEIVDFWKAEGNADLERRLRQAREEDVEFLIAGGGDGTMTQTANAFAYTDTTVGVLPLGTGNSFALTLGIDGGLEGAVDVIARERVVRVDLGFVNDRYFANFATIGFAAEVAESTDRNLKLRIGALAYFVAAVRPFITHRGFRAKVCTKKRRFSVQTQQILVVNGRFFGNRAIAQDASDTNGKLAFFTAAGGSRAEILKTYLAFALGVHDRLPEACAFSSKRIRIQTRPRQPLNIDGEALGETPARFSVAKRALRVLVPANFIDYHK